MITFDIFRELLISKGYSLEDKKNDVYTSTHRNRPRVYFNGKTLDEIRKEKEK